MTVGSQKYYTGHTAVGRAFRKSQWPNPTNIRRGSAPQRGTPCCSFRIGESPTLQMLEFPAESPLAVRRCRFAVAPSPQRAGSKLARVQPFKARSRECSQRGIPLRSASTKPQALNLKIFAASGGPTRNPPLQIPNRRGSSPSKLATGHARNEEFRFRFRSAWSSLPPPRTVSPQAKPYSRYVVAPSEQNAGNPAVVVHLPQAPPVAGRWARNLSPVES
jgi:hypothetical protein